LLIVPTIGIGWIESWHNEQRAVQIVLLVVTAIAWLAMLAATSRGSDLRPEFPPLLLALMGIGLVSSIGAGWPISAFAEVGMATLLIVLALVTASTVRHDPDRAVELAGAFSLLWGSAYVLGVATRYMASVNLERAPDLDVLLLGYANPRFPSAMHAALMPLIAGVVADMRAKAPLRAVAFAVLACLWAINIGLGTRAIWFAFGLSYVALLLVLGRRPMFSALLILTGSAVVGASIYYVAFDLIPSLSGLAGDQAPPARSTMLTSRDVLWSVAWRSIEESPLLGIGPLQFAARSDFVGAHPHNWPLQIAAEWGVLALGLTLVLLARFGADLRHRILQNRALVMPALSVSVALSCGLVDGNLVMPVSQSAFALAVGLAVGCLPRSVGPRRAGVLEAMAVPAVIVAGAVVAAFAIGTYSAQRDTVAEFRKQFGGAWLVPRFWEQGLIGYEADRNRR